MFTRRLVLVAILAISCLAGNASAFADIAAIEAAARKEGALTWYVASIDAANAEKAGRAFLDKYGVKVSVVRAASETMFQRLDQDLSQGAANADVFSSVDIGNFVTLKANGALVAYTPENAIKLLPQFRNLDPEGFFHATVASVIAISYNTQKLKPEEAPQKWPDLLDPKWKDKIAVGDIPPTAGSSALGRRRC